MASLAWPDAFPSGALILKAITPLRGIGSGHARLIYGLGGGHTHTHTHTHTHFGGMKVISRNQARAGLRSARAWFNWGEPERAPHWLENRVYERHVYGGYERKNAMTIVCTSVT